MKITKYYFYSAIPTVSMLLFIFFTGAIVRYLIDSSVDTCFEGRRIDVEYTQSRTSVREETFYISHKIWFRDNGNLTLELNLAAKTTINGIDSTKNSQITIVDSVLSELKEVVGDVQIFYKNDIDY